MPIPPITMPEQVPSLRLSRKYPSSAPRGVPNLAIPSARRFNVLNTPRCYAHPAATALI